MTKPKLDEPFVDKLEQMLSQVPSRTKKTTYEVIRDLAPLINQVRERGHDFDSIAKLLATAGLRLAPTTIRRYLRRAHLESANSQHPPKQPQTASPDHTVTSSNTVTRQPPQPTAKAAPQSNRPRVPSSPTSGRFQIIEDRDEL